MKIEIDQSGKIEDTARKTIIADSEGMAVYITSVDKRFLQSWFRNNQTPRMFLIKVFAALCCLLINSYTHTKIIYFIIDIEYDGLENDIKAYIMRYLSRLQNSLYAHQIRFQRIGKTSLAHKYAYRYAKDSTQRKFIKKVSLQKIFTLIT